MVTMNLKANEFLKYGPLILISLSLGESVAIMDKKSNLSTFSCLDLLNYKVRIQT